MRKLTLLLITVILAAGSSCAKTDKPVEKPAVFVSILPQRYIVSRIAGDSFRVEVMVRPGHSPENYEPLPLQMASLSGAAAYFTIGVPFEKIWLDKIKESNPAMRIIDTTEGVTLRKFDDFEEHHDEGGEASLGHEADDGHDHSGADPHTWLSPTVMKIQSGNICRALIAIDPGNRRLYEKNLAFLIADLDGCSEQINNSLKNLKEREFMVFHPAFGYFADEFGLRQIPVEVEGKEPGPETLKKMIDRARELNVKVIFVQKQFSTRSAEAVAEGIGGSVVQIDPLEEDYIGNLHTIARQIAQGRQ